MKPTLKNLITALALIMTSQHIALAQESDTTTTAKKTGIVEKILRALSYENGNFSTAIYPAASYSDKTGFAIGIMPLIQIDIEGTDKPTTFTSTVMVSTEKMFQVQVNAEAYLRNSNNIISKFEYFSMPDYYYGTGNQDKDSTLADYDYHSILLNGDLLKAFDCGWEVGLTFDVSRFSFSDYSDTNDLIIAEIENAEGWNNGLGVAVAYDSRDDVLAPRTGWYFVLRAMSYGKYVGSDFNFGLFTLDGRRYVPIGEQSTLALQAYWSGRTGTAPFYNLSTFGGTRLGRAIPHNLKYVDNYSWLLQGEMRVPLFWRLGATGFVGAGNVSHKALEKTFDDTHLMAGVGLRLKVFPSKNLKVRFDVGFSSRGDNAIYFNIKEAF